jgi:diaminohydroxyphosphoribosylaminopyrimidine deaminase/5-amino-6-(5-phosphoribosylamino)uracil reductase
VHRLRAQCDAVIVGGGTLRADDPLLTTRGQRQSEPLRVVLSRSLALPPAARLWHTSAAPTLVAHGPEAPAAARAALDERLAAAGGGLERLELPACEPAALLQALAARGCNQVLWECGPQLAAAAIRQGCVQRLAAVVAPKLLGGTPARTPLGDLGLERVADAIALQPAAPIRSLGGDALWLLDLPAAALRSAPDGPDPP